MTLPTATTTLAAVAGYIPTGTRKYWFVPTIASTSAPTLSELSAGTDLTNQVSDSSGFTGTGDTVDAPNAGSRWTSKVPGLISADDSSLTFVMAKNSTDARSLFNDGSDGSNPTTGFVVIFYEGNVTTGKIRVFPVQCTSVQPSTPIADLATLAVMYAITTPPSAFIAIPTA